MLQLLFFVSLRCIPLLATDFVELFIVKIANGGTSSGSDSKKPIQFTLWFDYAFYEYTQQPPFVEGDVYTFTSNSSMNPFQCTDTDETMVMIEHDDTNAIDFDQIHFNTISGSWYGIDQFCLPETVIFYDPYILDDSVCGTGTKHYDWLCIDNDDGLCGTYKQIVYFDTFRPNEFIKNAVWSDATYMVPNITPCDTTINPSKYPTINPSKYPTQQPTKSPSKHTTIHPSKYPTINPSKYPTLNPSKYPTLNPSKYPTLNPAEYSQYTTIHPFNYSTTQSSIASTDATQITLFTSSTEQATYVHHVTHSANDKPAIADDILMRVLWWVIICVVAIIIGFLVYIGFYIFYAKRSKQSIIEVTKNDECEDRPSIISIANIETVEGYTGEARDIDVAFRGEKQGVPSQKIVYIMDCEHDDEVIGNEAETTNAAGTTGK